MIKTLVFARMGTLFRSFMKNSRSKKKSSPLLKGLAVLLGIYVLGCFGLMFGALFVSMVVPFSEMKMEWLYFSMVGILCVTMGFFGSIFATQSQLYDAKDNELLLSFPIKPGVILASRMVLLLFLVYIIEGIIAVPAGVVYAVYVAFTPGELLVFIIAFLALPFLILSITCVLGSILAYLNSKIRRKNMFTMILSLGFLFGYFYGYSKVSKYISYLVENGKSVGEAIEKSLFPIYHMGISIAEVNWTSLLIYLGCCLIPFVIVYMILSKLFIQIATAKKGAVRVKYKERPLKETSVRGALIGKEFSRFISSPAYMLNAGLGLIMMLVMAGMVVVKGDQIFSMLELSGNLKHIFGQAMVMGIAICCSTTIISAPSLSMEGRSLWIVRSIPVSSGEILTAKAYLHILISLPFIVISATICNFVVKDGLVVTLLMYLLPIAVTMLFAFFGIIINLKFPKFDWIHETAAVKQGASTMITMFAGFGFLATFGLLYFFLLKELIAIDMYLLIITLFFFLVSWLEYRFLMTVGKRMLEKYS